ncbi:MAG: hypothetical protein A2Y12_18245 [Planctomycetes bacterium GWF2_42_9]|nr:MAG: hypothetical protein A2Y12_18245 [Planctomycetes bacterium GWF2_42_9]
MMINDKMTNIKILTCLVAFLAFAGFQAGAAVVNTDWYSVFADEFSGEPTGNADQGLLDKGWTFEGTYNYIKQSGGGEVWMESATSGSCALVSPKITFTQGTEYYVQAYGTNNTYQWAEHFSISDDSLGNDVIVQYRKNDKRVQIMLRYNRGSWIYLPTFYTYTNTPDYSLIINSTTLDLWVGGQQVDLNGSDPGMSYTHSFAPSVASAGFVMKLMARPNGSTAVMKYAQAAQILTAQKLILNCTDVWSEGYGLKADLNKDCEVNFKDFAEFAEAWLLCNNPDPADCL